MDPALAPLFDLGVIIVIATLFAYIASKLKQPLIVAYVAAGMIIGPIGFGLITGAAEIASLSELGVAFLLFAIGLEIDIKKLKAVGTPAAIGAVAQVGITFVLGLGISLALGLSFLMGIYMGLLLAFSSTMIVAKLLADSHEIGTLHGRMMLGILIVQDIIVIMVLPILMNMSSTFSAELISTIVVKGLGLFCIALVLNRYVFKRILDQAAKSKEVLFLTSVSTCFVFIGLSHALGFSIAIGAFLGGLAMAQFPYNIEIFGEMRSLRDFFAVVFFTSLGMQLNVMVMYTMFPVFIIFLLLIIIAKPLIFTGLYLLLGYGGRTSSNVGLGLGQASEFSFIIAAQGLVLFHLTQDMYSMILSLLVVSIIVTPYMFKYHTKIYARVRDTFGISHRHLRPRHVDKFEKTPSKPMENHTVVFGAGTTGEKVIRFLRQMGERFIVIEHDPEVARKLSAKGVYCMFGEADNDELLKSANLYKAKLAVLTVPDMDEVCFVIRKAKRFNPGIKIIARVHSIMEEKDVRETGADIVLVSKVVTGDEMVRKMGKVLEKNSESEALALSGLIEKKKEPRGKKLKSKKK